MHIYFANKHKIWRKHKHWKTRTKHENTFGHHFRKCLSQLTIRLAHETSQRAIPTVTWLTVYRGHAGSVARERPGPRFWKICARSRKCISLEYTRAKFISRFASRPRVRQHTYTWYPFVNVHYAVIHNVLMQYHIVGAICYIWLPHLANNVRHTSGVDLPLPPHIWML